MGCYLADMQSLSKFIKGIKYLLCVIDLFTKYAWVIPIKDKKGTSIVNAFKKEYAPIWSEEVFVVSKIKNTVPWTLQLLI